MSKIDFAHIHCHSCYSIQDAMPQLKDYVNAVYTQNQNSSKYNIVGFACTDHGSLSGIVDQYTACNEPDFTERKTKALYGVEIYHCEDINNNPNNDRFHLVLIAKNDIGLHNIYQIASHAGTHLIYGRQKNFPTTDINFLKTHGIGVIASSACFTKGHKIITINGEKNIEDIVSGDLVVTEDGSFQKVINPTSRKYCDIGYNLSFEKNGRDITCTKNHKFLIYDNKKKTTSWKEANQLKITDNCLFPIYKPKYTNISMLDISNIVLKCPNKKYDSKRRNINVNIPITHKLMRTIGLWLADGSVSYDDNKGYYRVDFTFGEKDFDIYYNNFVKNGMDLFGIKPNITRRPNYHGVDLSYNSKELAFVFKEMFGCVKADTKYIPTIFKNISEDYNCELLYGYLLGNGYFRYREKDGYPTGEIVSATISKQLHCDILELYNLCGFAPSVKTINEKTDTNGVHHNESYYISLSCKDLTLKLNKENILNHKDLINTIDKYRFSKNCFVNINNQFYLRKRVNNIKTIFLDTDVYCMNVENNHSFICNGIIVHNCLGGMIPKLITNGQYDEAEKYALLFNDIFDEFYLEVQPLEISEQLIVNDFLVKLSKKTGIPLIITSDSHYINKTDSTYHDILKDITHQLKFPEPTYLRSPEEMEEYCIKYNIPLNCISNTGILANHCNVNPKPISDKDFFPEFPCPKGYNVETYLRKKAFEGLKIRLIENNISNPTKYIRQILYELDVICGQGYAGYFLILSDWIKWCRDNGILVGPGRGSAAGSIVTYALRITSMDPIKNGFIFERFLSPERVEVPDCDIDIPRSKRGEAISYFVKTYGVNNVAQIVTFGKYKLKNVTKDVMSYLGCPFKEANSITKDIPDMIDGKEVTWDLIEGIAVDPSNEKYSNFTDQEKKQVSNIYDKYQDLFRKYPIIYDAIKSICGCIKSTGCHAGGVIICKEDLRKHSQIYEPNGSSVLPVIQFDMHSIDFMKMLKIDALGLSTLDVIKETMDLAGLDYDWYDSEEYDDPKVYEMLRNGETTDIFQMAGYMATKMINDFKVNNIEGLTAVNAGNRPGPLEKNSETGKSMVDLYAERRETNIVPSIDPRIDDILKDTYGCIYFQEQCIFLGQRMAGYTLGKADSRVRKPLCKKKVKMIPEIRNEFIYGKKSLYDEDHNVIGISEEDSPNCIGAVRNGFSLEMANQIFDTIEAFAKYSSTKYYCSLLKATVANFSFI